MAPRFSSASIEGEAVHDEKFADLIKQDVKQELAHRGLLIYLAAFLLAEAVNLVYVGILIHDRDAGARTQLRLLEIGADAGYVDWLFAAIFFGTLLWDVAYIYTGIVGATFADSRTLALHYLLALTALPALPWFALYVDFAPNVVILSLRLVALAALHHHVLPAVGGSEGVYGLNVRQAVITFYGSFVLVFVGLLGLQISSLQDETSHFVLANRHVTMALNSLMGLFAVYLGFLSRQSKTFRLLSGVQKSLLVVLLGHVAYTGIMTFSTGVNLDGTEGLLGYLPLFGRAPDISAEHFDQRRWWALECWVTFSAFSLAYLCSYGTSTSRMVRRVGAVFNVTWLLQLAYAGWMVFNTLGGAQPGKHIWYAKELIVSAVLAGLHLVVQTTLSSDEDDYSDDKLKDE